MSSRHFPDTRRMFFELWKQIVKIVSLSVHLFFSGKKIPGKMFSLIILFRMGGGGVWTFLKKFVEKTDFWRKLSAELSERDSTLPEGLFEERHVFPKTFPINTTFQTISIILVFLRFFEFLSKRCPCVQMKILRKSFFDQIFVYDFFPEFEQILSYFDNTTSTDCQNCALSV